MTKEATKQIGRLAMREEGPLWVGYYALPDTMKDSIFLGSILLSFLYGRPDRKRQFMDLMRDSVGDIIEDVTGHRPTWPNDPVGAPEHERAHKA